MRGKLQGVLAYEIFRTDVHGEMEYYELVEALLTASLATPGTGYLHTPPVESVTFSTVLKPNPARQLLFEYFLGEKR